MFQKRLEKYAQLVVQIGVAIQKGQTLYIQAPIEAAQFVQLVTEQAYEAGAKHVYVDYIDEKLIRLKYDLAPDDAFLEYPQWKAKAQEELCAKGAAFLSIHASNPELLKGVQPERIANATKVAGDALKTFRSYISSNKVSWNVISVPTKDWAKKVFPNESEEDAIEKLWDAIFTATRVDLKNPIQAWKTHFEKLEQTLTYLNNKHYKALHYRAEGTDITIELPETHIWVGGRSCNENGVLFAPNIPTEEVFTAPLKTGVHGYVTNTKPLLYKGNIIDNFTLTFENGRIVSYTAKVGEDTLRMLIESDEGSHYLGEIALVPHQSPISNMNIVFYNTLFDENASCHLAIGNAYPFNIEGGKTMSKEELEQHHINTSISHSDFMVGSANMNIDGITQQGSRESIFRNGNWAIY